MNKAAFLDILHHVSAISDQEIRELEQLALNFPYCQSAHLLLAKAAYDRGSMLSNQKLRRAAACATNRQLLKKLIYTSGTDLVVAPIAPPEEIASLITPIEIEVKSVEKETFLTFEVEQTTEDLVEPIIINLPEHAPKPIQELTTNETYEDQPEIVADSLPTGLNLGKSKDSDQHDETKTHVEEITSEEDLDEKYSPEEYITQESQPEKFLSEGPLQEEYLSGEYLHEDTLLEELTSTESRAEENNLLEKEIDQLKEINPQVQHETVLDFSEDYDALFTVDSLNQAMPLIDPVATFISNEIIADFRDDVETDIIGPEKEFGISLPVSDFESTASDITSDLDLVIADDILSRHDPIDANEPVIDNTLLDVNVADLKDDETLIRFDEYLFKPEKELAPVEINTANKDYQEEIIYKVFDANDLGYWMESSRLGETLLLKDELATSQPFYFSPELFLEYSKHHEITSYEAPPASILTRQLDIIDQFLKLNPKLKSMSNLKLRLEPQEDLSSRSTKIKKNLASENLANILVQQGKIKKAIKIYEHLILRIPEKKAYFASQIEKLQSLT